MAAPPLILGALVMNLVSLGASIGVLVLIFQDGHLEDRLGFSSTGGIESVIPPLVLAFGFGLAAITAFIAVELRADRSPAAVQPHLLRLGEDSSRLPRSRELSAEVVLAQLRSIIADLLRMTGMGGLESTDAIPPLAS